MFTINYTGSLSGACVSKRQKEIIKLIKEDKIIKDIDDELVKNEKEWYEVAGATACVAATSVVSGVLKIREYAQDGLTWLGGMAVSGVARLFGQKEFAENIEEKVVSKILEGIEIYVPLGALVDTEKELARLKGELDKVESEIKRAEGKLSNQGFVAKAPAQVIEGERAKLAKYLETREALTEALRKLG